MKRYDCEVHYNDLILTVNVFTNTITKQKAINAATVFLNKLGYSDINVSKIKPIGYIMRW